MTNELIAADESGNEFPTRRLAIAAAAGGCVLAVAGCSSYGEDAAAVVDANKKPASGAPSTGEGGTENKAGTGTTKSLALVADVPVGGGLILKKQGVVLTQPTKGKIKAFSTTCTHAGCAVTKVKSGTIDCPCHGSKFAIEDGAPTHGPAKNPLESVKVKVKGKKVYMA